MAGFLPGYESGLNHKDPTTEPGNGDKAADERLVLHSSLFGSFLLFGIFAGDQKKKKIIIYYPGKKGSNETASSCS